MLDLGALRLSINLDSKEANKGLDDFKANTDEAENKSKLNFSKIKGAIVGAGITTAIVGASKALYGMATDAAATADRIDKLSAKTGLSKEGFQEWDYVLAQNGASIEGMQMGIKTLTGLMDSAASGTTSAQDTFKALNLTWDDGNGKLKSQEQMMEEALYALADMENGTEKARLATELFGKSGSELMPMLNGGSEGMKELQARAHELGLVMGDEAVTAGVVLGDTIDDVKKSFGAIVTQIGVYVMPIIQTLLDWILAHLPQIQAVFKFTFSVIGTVINIVIDIVKAFVDAIKWCVEKVTSFLDYVADTYKAFKDAGKQIFNSVWEGMKGIWNDIVSWVSEKVNWLIDKLAFWRSGSKEINGSHRTGLREVPFDGYTAELHKGEMVLTAAEAKRYQQGNTATAATTNLTVNNYSPIALSVAESARLFKQTQRELALGF